MKSEEPRKPGISLFIPVYNCANLIGRDLRRAYETLLRLNSDFEIVIVDDNSTDKSYRFKKIIDKAKTATGRDLVYIACSNGPSRRENLAQAFFSAKYDIIGFIDADFSCDIHFIFEAVERMKRENADVVIGSRYIHGAKVKRRPMRRIFSFFYNLIIQVLYQSRIYDHQCGLKVFRKQAGLPIVKDMGYDHEFIRGWFWDAEFLIRAQRAKLKIVEMPVVWKYADSSTFNFRRELRCLTSIFGLRKKLLVKKQVS